ncbi:MAG: glycoside hydrolase family 28 protein [Candidatus Moraniibacteriota bacterium]
MSIRSLRETLKRHIGSKKEAVLFFVLAFFIFFGLFSFARISLEKIWSWDILSKGQISRIAEAPTIDYLFRAREIATPDANTLSIKEPLFPDHVCSIADYGAIADGKTSNTEAFQQAIAACAAAGGGQVIVPPGIWLTGPIRLQSNIELHVERDAKILFSTNAADYLPVVFSRFEGIEYYNYSPPIYAAGCTNVAVTGAGTLDGQGPILWWKMKDRATASINALYAMGDDNIPLAERVFGTEAAGLRPAFIEFVHCSNVLVENVRIVNGPMWTIHPLYSDHIIIRDVDIRTSPGPSTDGIVIDSASNVLIENSTLDTGDDAIVLKSGRDKEGMRLHRPTENVIIRNSIVNEAHGAIAIGSEVSGDVRNVFVSNIDVEEAQFGFRIKAPRGRGGIVENVWVENMAIKHASIEAIQIATSYGMPFRIDSTTPPLFRNIHLKNISAEKTSQAISINGLPDLPVSDVSVEDIIFATRLGIKLTHTDGIDFKNIHLTPKDNDPLFVIVNSSHINLNNTACTINIPICLLLKDGISTDINIRDSGFEQARTKGLTDATQER